MNKEQLIKELNTYSKDEIIKAIADTDKIVATRVTSILFRHKSKDIDALVDAAFKKWQQASDEYIAYFKKVKEDYKNVPILKLPQDVRDKLLALMKAEDAADKDLQAMYKKQDKFYEKNTLNT